MLPAQFPGPMPRLPAPDDFVCWRSQRHAYAIGYAQAFGPGPFRVVCIVDKTEQGIPAGIVVETGLGQREINEVWLAMLAHGGDDCDCTPVEAGAVAVEN